MSSSPNSANVSSPNSMPAKPTTLSPVGSHTTLQDSSMSPTTRAPSVPLMPTLVRPRHVPRSFNCGSIAPTGHMDGHRHERLPSSNFLASLQIPMIRAGNNKPASPACTTFTTAFSLPSVTSSPPTGTTLNKAGSTSSARYSPPTRSRCSHVSLPRRSGSTTSCPGGTNQKAGRSRPASSQTTISRRMDAVIRSSRSPMPTGMSLLICFAMRRRRQTTHTTRTDNAPRARSRGDTTPTPSTLTFTRRGGCYASPAKAFRFENLDPQQVPFPLPNRHFVLSTSRARGLRLTIRSCTTNRGEHPARGAR